MHIDTLAGLATTHGLILRGGFNISSEDAVPVQASGEPFGTLVLFGQSGSAIWPAFSTSAEYTDGAPDPLDRWSERIAISIARELDGLALLPFGGPPYHPFIRWAQRAEALLPSRLGLLLHPEFGLWHAYRFAIALGGAVEGLTSGQEPEHACDRCLARPCLSSCPADAFDGHDYNVRACFAYLEANPQCDCLRTGCKARAACPEGRGYRYTDAQARFHIVQFHHALKRRFSIDEARPEA